MAANVTPEGCGPDVDSLYYNLCDLSAVWGIVLEAFAAAGIVFSLVLFISLLASLPFMKDKNRRSSVALHAFFLVCTAGLFCLTFAFIVGKDFSTCASRRFLFGVLFGGCFACLLMQCVRLNILARRNSGPRAWVLFLGAVGLWLVEVVINTEWLIITVVRHPLRSLNVTAESDRATATPCNIANQDFVMALIYVMTLILAVVVASLAIMAGKHKQWKKDGACILLTSLSSLGIWVAWIVMYVYGNEKHGGPTWDDPTLAIALVANAWVFIIIYTIPEICCLSSDDESQQSYGGDLYPNQGAGYETILKEQSSQSMFMENKAFSMDEPNQGAKPVSPYSGYTGQLRSSVYQPTELALITKALGNHPKDPSYDMVIPRASTNSAANSGSTTPSTHTETGNTAFTQTNGNSGNGLHRTSQW
ncbi:G-protein coupled receptor family C group 5 member C isoform X1 [Seriola lalandi dorsalis]|uniref:G protein-coupled receptor, class C, group 5, member C n=1 Tax=Seriola lalandi dorsalis TaxID=1841481 RepID=A0A3B4YBW5_SERLL|nr:G-protein coupled receptor family C group 5 member C isoform X1 [Seriola lalandi dorsalis]XP_023274569.1 G-protein coupled receptor family C group 5 member C isoform X1 [Seriola lalandi dorsalis]XP_056221595.1 G-protein coupled receptor family C group 5 member C isoform X1 [Seriola aureovittata]XP_056221596.1 G-protein coupled receptor family C group 5 member C isoform X1 [Seriola aureovittata]XP_056221597.1 G-protein coupled receptor family C group 5 member C isoform X1 [Seriola aureovittat